MAQQIDWISDEIADLKERGLFTNIRTIESSMDGWVEIDGRRVLNFSANNYLGLANHPVLREAAKDAIDAYGIGPGAVRTIAGTMDLHDELERRLAAFKGVEAAVTTQSGFTANLAAIPALVGRGDVIFSDELNHASIIDGCRLSRADVMRFNHADPEDLREKVAATETDGRKMIITDGVFSMDGDIAPLDELYEVAQEYDCLLMVDDAHGEGVLGHGGRGIVDHFGLHGQVDVEIGTMSKAFGVIGGVIAGKQLIIDWMKQRARPFLFSSAMTIPDVAACIAAIDLLEESTDLVDRLWRNAEVMKEGFQSLGFDTGHTQTPVIPVMLGDANLAQSFSRRLFEEGVFAMAIGYPTVPRGKARIRVMNTAAHTPSDLEVGLAAFEKVGKELDVI